MNVTAPFVSVPVRKRREPLLTAGEVADSLATHPRSRCQRVTDCHPAAYPTGTLPSRGLNVTINGMLNHLRMVLERTAPRRSGTTAAFRLASTGARLRRLVAGRTRSRGVACKGEEATMDNTESEAVARAPAATECDRYQPAGRHRRWWLRRVVRRQGAGRGAGPDVLILDRRNHHLFQPLLYQVATAALSPANIAQPIRVDPTASGERRGATGRGRGRSISTAKSVTLDNGRHVSYDALILAAGTSHAYFGHDEWEPLAPGLKSSGRRADDPAPHLARLRGGGADGLTRRGTPRC